MQPQTNQVQSKKDTRKLLTSRGTRTLLPERTKGWKHWIVLNIQALKNLPVLVERLSIFGKMTFASRSEMIWPKNLTD